MRLISLFKKTMIENFRDWKIIILTLTFAPFFVLLMYMYFVNTTNIFRIVVINRDEGAAATGGNFFYAGEELISELKRVRSPEGAKILKVRLEKEIPGSGNPGTVFKRSPGLQTGEGTASCGSQNLW